MRSDIDRVQALMFQLDQLSPEDRTFVQRCAAELEAGGELTEEDRDRLRGIQPPDSELEA